MENSNNSYTYPNFPLSLTKSSLHFERYKKFVSLLKRRYPLPSLENSEVHHLIPKSLGGSDSDENLLRVSYREHYLLHLCLWKCFGGSMTKSFYLMSHYEKNKINSVLYERLKKDYTKLPGPMTGKKHTKEAKEKISLSLKGQFVGEKNPMYGKIGSNFGKTFSEETKRKIGLASKNRHYSEKTKQRMSSSQKGLQAGEKHPMYGKHHSEETRRKIGESSKGEKSRQSYQVYCLETKEYFGSLSLAAKNFKISSASVHKSIHKKVQLKKHQLTFLKVSKEEFYQNLDESYQSMGIDLISTNQYVIETSNRKGDII